MDLWLPGYEHDPEPGAGLSVAPGRPKVVIHTTESGPGTLAAIRNLWRGSSNWGKGLPHFIAEGDRYVQLLPLDVGAYTLQNSPGGADTNRSGPAIQVEIVGFARDEFTAAELDALGRWLADLVRAGVDLDLSQHPRFYGEGDGIVLASESSPIRMGAGAFTAFGGFCGHQHVPENDHWDPGHLDADRVETIARLHLSGGALPVVTKETDMPAKPIHIPARGDAQWLIVLDGNGRRRREFLSGARRLLLVATGALQPEPLVLTPGLVDALGINHDELIAEFDSLPETPPMHCYEAGVAGVWQVLAYIRDNVAAQLAELAGRPPGDVDPAEVHEVLERLTSAGEALAGKR